MNSPLSFPLIIKEKTVLTHNVLELKFDKPKNFSFIAGQFIQILVPDNQSTLYRAYSISSTPADNFIELCIKLLPNGRASDLLQKIEVGKNIEVRGPYGRFIRTESNGSLMCIATGVGITPVISVITDELKNKKIKNTIHLLFGVRHETDIFWLERLETLVRDYSNFTYTLTLSQPSQTWNGKKGRVTEHLKPPHDQNYYISGSAEMVKDVRALLTQAQVNSKNIHIEIF